MIWKVPQTWLLSVFGGVLSWNLFALVVSCCLKASWSTGIRGERAFERKKRKYFWSCRRMTAHTKLAWGKNWLKLKKWKVEHRKATREKKPNYKTRGTWKAGSLFYSSLCRNIACAPHLAVFLCSSSQEDTLSSLMLALEHRQWLPSGTCRLYSCIHSSRAAEAGASIHTFTYYGSRLYLWNGTCWSFVNPSIGNLEAEIRAGQLSHFFDCFMRQVILQSPGNPQPNLFFSLTPAEQQDWNIADVFLPATAVGLYLQWPQLERAWHQNSC